jgi:hypothetical protein
MLEPTEILGTALARWPAVLRAEAAGENIFPLQIPFGRPRTTDEFKDVKRDIEALAAAHHEWRIDWQEINTRRWGRQRWPMRITFQSADEMADALDRSHELVGVRVAVQQARAVCPALEPWLRAKAHRIVDYLGDWSALLAVCAFFHANPTPRCFARQIPLPVGTKFVEEHTGILRELLDVMLGDRIDAQGSTFQERFHLLVDPPQVRFRFLDDALRQRVGWPVPDCSVPAPTLADLSWNPRRVLIVENRDVFVCLPRIADTVAIFGSGKAASLLADAPWMNSADVLYWGDCDEAGFGILSELRRRFPHTRSAMMDDAAWCRWKHLAVPGRRDPVARHTHLTPEEQKALQAILAGPWMLEQERIPLPEAELALRTAISADSSSVVPTGNRSA